MENHPLPQRINLDLYLRAVRDLKIQFELLQAAKRLDPESLARFYSQKCQEATETLMASFTGTTTSDVWKAMAEAEGMSAEAYTSKLADQMYEMYRKELNPAQDRKYREGMEDSLRQSEFLLLVAYFEYFLKELVQRLLEVDHQSAFQENETPVKLQDVLGRVDLMEFVREQIVHALDAFDRKSIKEKNKWLAERYRLSFGDKPEVDRLNEFSKRRNNISHVIFALQEKPILVSREELSEARELYISVARGLWFDANERYPNKFPV